MEDNLYLIEIIYIIFYAFLALFIYLNYVAITNFSESNKIIIENASPQCLPSIQNLPAISESDLIPCKPITDSKGKTHVSKPFYYYNEDNNLAFIVSNNQEDAGNFLHICKSYCHGKINSQNKCVGSNQIPYKKCIDLLQPPPNCTNSSVAIAIDKTSDSFFYAYSYADSSSPNNAICK